MKTKLGYRKKGSVLMIALLTITILAMLCATSLYITSQNANATTQATSWEQSMTGAEAAVDYAMNALNTGSWSGWYSVTSSSLPTAQPSPSGSPNASATPGSGKYNYYTSSFALQGEASNTITWWVTVDNGSVAPTPSPSPGLVNGGQQAWRIRAAAVVDAPGPKRVSNNKLDNDLRQIALQYNHLTNAAVSSGHGQATRRIEVIATPVASTGTGRGITMATGANLGGGSTVDSFSSGGSSNPSAWSLLSRDPKNPQVMGIVNNTWSQSDLGNQYVYGGLTYSGTTEKNTNNVTGGIVTPYPYGAPTPAPTPPTGVTYTQYTGNNNNPPNSGSFTAQNSSAGTTYIQINGDLSTSNNGAGQYIYIQQHDNGGTENVVISVLGNLRVQGGGYIKMDPNVKVTLYVSGDIIIQGGYVNGNPNGIVTSDPTTVAGYAGNLVINGYASYDPNNPNQPPSFTESGNSMFTGVINAPNYTTTVQGGGATYTGALIGNTFTLSGGASFHYDESLGSGSANGSKYAFTRWFEDNSDPTRKDQNGNPMITY